MIDFHHLVIFVIHFGDFRPDIPPTQAGADRLTGEQLIRLPDNSALIIPNDGVATLQRGQRADQVQALSRMLKPFPMLSQVVLHCIVEPLL